MTSVTNTIMRSKATVLTHDDDEGDQRLIIDEGDRNNNEKSQWLISTEKIRPVTPNSTPSIFTPLKIKTESQLEVSTKSDTNSVASGSIDSQLRKALEKRPKKDISLNYLASLRPTTTSSSLSSTPLLAASLSRPPVAKPSSSLATLASVAVAASATSSTITINSNVVDLSLRNNKQNPVYSIGPVKPNKYHNNKSYPQSNETLSPIKDNCKMSLHSPSDVYANFLMELRNAQARINNGSRSLSPLAVVQQVQEQMIHDSTPNHHSISANVINSKITAAARKEKLRLHPSFQCPVCKKRFQRHIAMNAHFQNEHIGSTETEKVCKLCSHTCPDIAGIRTHLITRHSIDLDSPTACLVEGESLPYEYYNVAKQTPASSPHSPSSSSSPSQTIQNTDSAEACYNSKKSNRRKSKNNKSSYEKIKYQGSPSATNVHSSLRSSPKREEILEELPDTASHDESSSSSSTSNMSSSSLNAVDAITSSSIQKSNNYTVKGNSSVIEDDKDSPKCIKQEPKDESSSFNNLQQQHYDEATDLTIKKIPIEMQSSSKLKRRAPPSCSQVTSDNLLMFSDVEPTSISKRIKSVNKTSKGAQELYTVKIVPSKSEDSKLTDAMEENVFQFKCQYCSILFPNQTLYFLHKGFHSEGSNPWRCNGCGRCCSDMYDFNTHLMSDSHC